MTSQTATEEIMTGDFRDYCEMKAPPSCPTRNPSTEQTLANVQLETSGDNKYYVHPDFRSTDSSDFSNFGSTTPEQNILLFMATQATTGSSSNFVEIGLNDDAISFNQERDYYIYIDDDRYSLTIIETYTANNITHRKFDVTDYPPNVLLPNDFDVAIASESTDNQQCEFYVPSPGAR